MIKVDSSPINPSDFYTMRGVFKQVPCVVGLEGSGIVVKSGGGELADSLVGKRVAAVSEWEYDGFWSEYTVVNSEKAVVVADDVSLPVAANSYINPMTVRGFMEIIR